jgi:hypothetical protein
MKLNGNLNLLGGEMQNAKSHLYAALPAYVAATDRARIIFVTTPGTNYGFWMGDGDGAAAWTRFTMGTAEMQWQRLAEAIANGVTGTLTIAGIGTAIEKGFITSVTVASSVGAGLVVVQIYTDTTRLVKIYEATFDLATTNLTDRIPVYFDLDNVLGNLYVNVTNNTGGAATFDVTIESTGTQMVALLTPPGDGSGINAGVAGDGIAYDAGTATLEVSLAANPGLEIAGVALRVKVDGAGGISRGAGGLAADATIIRTTGAQALAGIKSFDQLRMTPTGISGPPVGGTHVLGEFSMDTNKNVWLCTVAGTPGTWVFYGLLESVSGGAATGASYTGLCAALNKVDLSLTKVARRGIIRKLIVWAAADAVFTPTNFTVNVRIECYPNENYEGRERLWSVSGIVDCTSLDVGAAAPATHIPLTATGGFVVGDLVRLRKLAGVDAEEYGRIITVTGGDSIDVDESTVNDLAIGDPAMTCLEFNALPWKNNSAVPANETKIYLRFWDDDAGQALNFGYHLMCEETGGGLTV